MPMERRGPRHRGVVAFCGPALLSLLLTRIVGAWVTYPSWSPPVATRTHDKHRRRREANIVLRDNKSSYQPPRDKREAAITVDKSNSRKAEDPVPSYIRPYYPKPRPIDESLVGDLTGGRPGAIVETLEEIRKKDIILQEIDDGKRKYPELDTDEVGVDDGDYDNDDPDALDMATLGTVTIQDYLDKFIYEWDPQSDAIDPNLLELQQEGRKYLLETPKDDDGVEIGYDPMYGPSNPFDERTIRDDMDSYVVMDESIVPKLFPNDIHDPEIKFNEDIITLRHSLDIIDSYVDPFLKAPVPNRVAKWHGYPEPDTFEPRDRKINLFTENPFDFDSLGPSEAKQKALEFALMKNAEWLPDGVSQQWHIEQRLPYEKYGTLIGTIREGPQDPALVERINPVLQVLNHCAPLLSIENDIYRFHYHGPMKDKFGMERYTETMLRDCGVEVANVIFETGWRRRDREDGGDYVFQAPSFY
jgi:hypothetical protein